ncbi:restriction endonuclease subunit S [Pseudoalteromonas maricaloris]
MNELPKGWFITPLNELAIWGAGGTPKRSEPSYYGGEIPWVKTGDLGPKYLKSSSEFITELGVSNSSAKLFKKGSVAIAMYGATIGKTSILDFDAATNQACAVGKPIGDVTTTEFLYYLLNSEKNGFINKGKGGAQPNISQQIIKSYLVALPPLNEQKRIVEKLDDVLVQVDAIKGRLDSIPAIIKRFRQSVFASAVSGKLTQTNLKKKKANLSQLGQLTGGKTPNKSNANFWEDGSILWISPKDMKSDVIEDSIDYITEAAITDGGMKYINKNSILMVTRSGILSHTFPVAITSKQVTINQDIKAFIPNQNEIIPRYALITLKGLGPRILRECSKSGTTVASVETKALVELEFALPPIQEQKEIVRLVDEYFALADTIEAQVNKARARVDKLTQSILAKAFRGELVPQDDNDEPAEKLLERIAQAKAEAEALAKAVKKAEAGKKRAAKTISK